MCPAPAARWMGCILLCALLLAGCGRPIDRPLSGAPPLLANSTPLPVLYVEPPPTLAAPTSIPSNPDRREPRTPHSGTPTPELGQRPILRTVQPAPNAMVAGGEVRMSAQIRGYSNLVEVTATLNGTTHPLEVMGRDERNWTAFFQEKLAPGEHEVRIVARDEHGLSGGLRWRFKVVPSGELPPSPSPVATAALGPARPKPLPTRTPSPAPPKGASPTPARQPTPAPPAKPTSTPAAAPPTKVAPQPTARRAPSKTPASPPRPTPTPPAKR